MSPENRHTMSFDLTFKFNDPVLSSIRQTEKSLNLLFQLVAFSRYTQKALYGVDFKTKIFVVPTLFATSLSPDRFFVLRK